MPKIFFFEKKALPLQRKWELTDGVMVTLQILVLSFKVRVLVGQQRKSIAKAMLFSLYIFFCLLAQQQSHYLMPILGLVWVAYNVQWNKFYKINVCLKRAVAYAF